MHPPGDGPWLALVVLVDRFWERLAQRRVVEVSAGGEPFAPLDELLAQDLLRLGVIGVGVQSVGFERRDARTIRPRDRFECTGARPQLTPTRLVYERTREVAFGACGRPARVVVRLAQLEAGRRVKLRIGAPWP